MKNIIIYITFVTVLLSCKDNKSETMGVLIEDVKNTSLHDKIVFDTIANIEINDKQVVKYLNSDVFNCNKFERDSLLTIITLNVRSTVVEKDSLNILLLNNKIFPLINESTFQEQKSKTNGPILVTTGGGAEITLNKKNEVIRFVKYQ